MHIEPITINNCEAVELSNGQSVAITRLSFGDSIALDTIAAPLIEDLQRVFTGVDQESVSVHEVHSVLGRHPQIIMRALARATGKPAKWLEAQNDADGCLLVGWFWALNRDYFLRRILIHKPKNGGETNASISPQWTDSCIPV